MDHTSGEKMETAEDECGAFIEKFQLSPPPRSSPSDLPLHGLTFAVKDIFDIAGYVTGFGNPDWARTHGKANSTSPVVLSILEAGAICVGKTIMDEMAYSINGENKHYGTPVNPSAPDCVPGGSSSGSAVAVAAKLVDFSIGTDTGGSVRVPAAYCGIFGFRPSHSVISTVGVIPMAPSFDTVGWFARDPTTLYRVGHILLELSTSDAQPLSQMIVADDCFQPLSFHGQYLSELLITAMEKYFGDHILKHLNLGEYISSMVPSLKIFMNEDDSHVNNIPSLSALSSAMRQLQRYEFKNQHGEWVRIVRPSLGPGISERVWEALKTTDELVYHCKSVQSELKHALGVLLQDHRVLAIPTVPGPPPKLLAEPSALEGFRARAFSLLSIAGMSGFCQVSVPLGRIDDLPVAISFIAKHGLDGFLLNLVQTISNALVKEACALEGVV